MIYKRGSRGIYWYKFCWRGELIRESTRQRNPRVARQIEAAHKTALAKGEVGIRDKKPSPTLTEFIERDFRPFITSTFQQKQKTRTYYEHGIKVLMSYAPLASENLNSITAEQITAFVATRQAMGLKVSSINRELEVLRRMFKLAMEWGKVDSVLPKVRMLPGEQRRDRVVTPDEEKRFLLAASPLLRDVAIVIIECGLRPEECYRLRKEDIRDGSIHIQYGKTEAARRRIPMSPRLSEIVERHSGESLGDWVFSAPTQSGHIEPSSVKRQQQKAFERCQVKPFPLYSLRHTCLTRWAPHMDPFTLAYLAGHSNMRITKRYVHPQEQTILEVMERVSGHKFGHNLESAASEALVSEAASH